MVDRQWLTGETLTGQVTDIARDLIGRRLIVRNPDSIISALILETEAYGGIDDPASHAAFRPAGRASLMFGPPGGIYVYAAYGIHPCFNIVTGPVGKPSAVLLRSVLVDNESVLARGPGRLTRTLGITIDDHGLSLGDGRFDISASRVEMIVSTTPRIGIARATDRRWRYVGTARESIVE